MEASEVNMAFFTIKELAEKFTENKFIIPYGFAPNTPVGKEEIISNLEALIKFIKTGENSVKFDN